MSASPRSTLLINCLIALGTKTPDFPHPLWDHGFQLETIDPKILLATSKVAKPDVQFKKHDNHLVFFECKDGGCEKDQLERYKSMTVDDIQRGHVTSLSSASLAFDLAYFGTEEKEVKLLRSIEKDLNTFPIIILYRDAIRLKGANRFRLDLLNDLFDEIQFDTPVPQSFVLFTPNDDDCTIATALIQHFAHRAGHTLSVEELVKDIFRSIIDFLPPEAIDELKGRIGRILSQMRRRKEMADYITFEDGKYLVKEKGLKAFKTACERAIEELRKEQAEAEQAKHNLDREWDDYPSKA